MIFHIQSSPSKATQDQLWCAMSKDVTGEGKRCVPAQAGTYDTIYAT